jgi:hypothetical protein
MSRPHWLLLAALGAAIALTAASAVAQDRVVPRPGDRAAPRALDVFVCREPTLTEVRTQNVGAPSASTSFNIIPDAQIVVVSAGPRCVKVIFSAVAACREISADGIPGRCIVRALLNGSAMQPGQITLLTEDSMSAGHAFEWMGRVESGRHIVRIERRVSDPDTLFEIGARTMDVQLLILR